METQPESDKLKTDSPSQGATDSDVLISPSESTSTSSPSVTATDAAEKDPNWMRAYNSLTRYLGARDHSELELRQKLRQKYSEELVEEMIDLAYAQNWMGDPKEISARTTQRLLEKGKGSRYIEAYLIKKGLPTTPISFDQELEAAQQAAGSKFGEKMDSGDASIDFQLKVKIQRFLSARGFLSEVINTIVFDR